MICLLTNEQHDQHRKECSKYDRNLDPGWKIDAAVLESAHKDLDHRRPFFLSLIIFQFEFIYVIIINIYIYIYILILKQNKTKQNQAESKWLHDKRN